MVFIMGDSSTETAFGAPVRRRPRLSDTVAEAILDTILSKGYRPGDALPSARELGEQFGVSRTVIREAVRSLTARGVVDAQAGRGLVVAAVGASDVSDALRLYLHGKDEIPYQQVHQVRTLIEVEIAGLAAERATDDEIADLVAHSDGMYRILDPEEHSRADVELHRKLAQMTHNELYVIVLDSLGDIMLAVRRATASLPDDRERARREHREIIEQIKARDPDGARDAMRRHLVQALKDWETIGDSVRLA